MPYPSWTPDEVAALRDATRRAGRPLEVATAEAFASRGWTVHLNTYYEDIFSKKARELDVLAHREETWEKGDKEFSLSICVYVSCKGFNPKQFPLSWSVIPEKANKAELLLCSADAVNRPQSIDLGLQAAQNLINATGLPPDRRMIGLKVCQQKDNPKAVEYFFPKENDNELYEGADSALKAALWAFNLNTTSHAEIHIPIVILDHGISDILIHKNRVNDPDSIVGGYMSSIYPIGNRQIRTLLTLIWTAERLSVLLDDLKKCIVEIRASATGIGFNYFTSTLLPAVPS
jgi:hypothetical protein